MTKKISVALGGTNILAVPVFLRGTFLTFTRLLGVNQFDTAQYYGVSEQVLSEASLRNVRLVSKWGLGPNTDPINPDPKRWRSEFPANQVESEVAKSRGYFAETVDFGFALHRPAEESVEEHIEILLRCRASGLVNRVGYSCDTHSEILHNNSWCDFIITHYSLVGRFAEFSGQVFLHGVFKDRLTIRDLRNLIAELSSCQEVSFLIGTSKPWRFIISLLLARRAARFER